MRVRATVFCLAVAACAVAQQVPKKVYRVETSDPKDIRMEVVHGETINLQWTFLSYANPLDIESAAVTLHARTNGMAEGVSFQVPGAAGPGGVATVRLAVSEWLPTACNEAEWTLEVVQPDAARILRAKGTVTATRSAAASTNDPVPVVWLDDIRAEIGAVGAGIGPLRSRVETVEQGTNRWEAAWHWGDHSAMGYLLAAALDNYYTMPQVDGRIADATNSIVIPVRSVNSKTGDIVLTADDVGALPAEGPIGANINGEKFLLIFPYNHNVSGYSNGKDLALILTGETNDIWISTDGKVILRDEEKNKRTSFYLWDVATTQYVGSAVAPLYENRDKIITLDGLRWIDATGCVWQVRAVTNELTTWAVVIDEPINISGTVVGASTNLAVGMPYPLWKDAEFDGVEIPVSMVGYSGEMVLKYKHVATAYGNHIYFKKKNAEYPYWYTNYSSGEIYGTSRYLLCPQNSKVWIKYGVYTQVVDVAFCVGNILTRYVPLAEKELHRDSHTNLIWESVYSNGWHFLTAYTNTPTDGGGE